MTHQLYLYKFLAYIVFVITLLLLPISASSNCTCEVEKNDQKGSSSKALEYKIVAICSILLAGALGVCLPLMAKCIPSLHPEKGTFFLIKAFAAGVILATGFIHVLPSAYASLTSPCLEASPWKNFPFTGLGAMLAAIGTLMMESFATGYHKRSESIKVRSANISSDNESNHEEENGGHVHGSAFALEAGNPSDIIRHRIVSQVLELGIVVHSVVNGLALGVSENPKTIKPLVAALSFHQFFEGIGLGGCIFQAELRPKSIAIMVIFFSITTPTGIAIGIGISNIYEATSNVALVVQGLLNSVSGGILIYMALVDILASDFMSSRLLTNFNLHLGASLALLLGMCGMSLLALFEKK